MHDSRRSPPPVSALVLAVSLLSAAAAAPAGDPPVPWTGTLLDLAPLAARIVDAAWTDRPEWGDMAVALLRGDGLDGPLLLISGGHRRI